MSGKGSIKLLLDLCARSELDFIQQVSSGGTSEGVRQAAQPGGPAFIAVALGARRVKNQMLPQLSAHRRQRVREGGRRLVVPGGLRGPEASPGRLPVGQQGHQREQPKQGWGRALDRLVVPL